VSSPQDSYNVLLLNYAGYGTALQAGSVTVNTNAVLTILGSMLSVTNSGTTNDQLLIDGTVNQGDNSAVRATYLGLGSRGAVSGGGCLQPDQRTADGSQRLRCRSRRADQSVWGLYLGRSARTLRGRILLSL